MKTINLQAGQTHIRYEELANLIADALWPDAEPHDDRWTYGAAYVNLETELAAAVRDGVLTLKDPLTFGPHTFPIGNALKSALVTIDDFRAFVAGRGLVLMNELQSDARLSQLPAKEAAIWETAYVGDDGKQRQVTRQFAGLSSTAWATVEEFLEEVTDRLARWRDGRYEIIEAAQIVADSNPEIDAVVFCKQMEDAAHSDKLTIRENGIPVSATELENGRIWNTPVRQTDVNKWLQAFNAGFELVYPYADTQPQAGTVEAVPEVAVGKRWTPEFTAEVEEYRRLHGTKKTAEKYGVTTGMIRQKLPSNKQQKHAYSVFTHRS